MTQTRRTEGVQQPRNLVDEQGDQSGDDGDGEKQIDFDKNFSNDEGIDSDKQEDNDDDGPEGSIEEDGDEEREDDDGGFGV